jgi:hypothetical protein
VLDSTKILMVSDGAPLPSDVRSGGESTTQILYLKSLIKLLICGLDRLIVCENCEADASKSTHVLAMR